MELDRVLDKLDSIDRNTENIRDALEAQNSSILARLAALEV